MLEFIFDNTVLFLLSILVITIVTGYLILQQVCPRPSYIYPVEVKPDSAEIDLLTYFNENYEKCLVEWCDKYPNECTINLGRNNKNLLSNELKIVLLNSTDAIAKFTKSTESNSIANRPNMLVFDLASKNFLGSFFRMYDNNLKEVRKSTIYGMHQLVIANKDTEAMVFDEVSQFIEFLNGKCFKKGSNYVILDDVQTHLQQISANIVVNVGIGARFDYDTNKDTAIKQQIRNFSELFTISNLVSLSKITKENVMTEYKTAAEFVQSRLNSIYSFVTDAVVGYKSTYDSNSVKTFADLLLSKQAEQIAKFKKLNPKDVYSDDDIIVQVFTMIMAAIATTGFTLSWTFYYLSKNKDVQKKIYDEIKKHAGGSANSVSWSLRNKMLYTEAFINEILRLSSTQSLIARSTLDDDLKVGSEYLLPPNTLVYINLYGIHHKSNNWSNPQECKPERWFDKDGKLLSNPNNYIPFGTLPRTCVGDVLTKWIIFSILTNLVLRYDFDYVSINKENNSNIGKMGIMRVPFEYNLKITSR